MREAMELEPQQPQMRWELDDLPEAGLGGADIFPDQADAGFDELHDLIEEMKQ